MLARRRPPIDIILPTRSVSMVLETNFFVVSLVTNLNNKRSVCDSQWCLQLSLKRTPLYIKLSWEVGIAVKQNKITQDKILLTWHVNYSIWKGLESLTESWNCPLWLMTWCKSNYLVVASQKLRFGENRNVPSLFRLRFTPSLFIIWQKPCQFGGVANRSGRVQKSHAPHVLW